MRTIPVKGSPTPTALRPLSSHAGRNPFTLLLAGVLLAFGSHAIFAETVLLKNAVVHTVSGPTLQRGSVLIQDGRINNIFDETQPTRFIYPSDATVIDLEGRHLYPGLVAINSVLGLTEINAVRATQDTTEVGEYTPDVESWIAVNPDSELLPVSRANGITHFEPVPRGGVVSGQSALLSMDGWTYEEMTVRKPVALHVFWPRMDLNTTPKERMEDPSKWKSLDEQAKERRARLRALADFFEEAQAYARAMAAAETNGGPALDAIPAWEAMLPYVRGELPIVVHANDTRQIESAVEWSDTNRYRIYLAGGRDAWMAAELLAAKKVPVLYEHTFTQPVRDTEPYDVHFRTPERLRRAGVQVVFSVGPDSFAAAMSRNLPYAAAQAVAFGLPAAEALKGITLYPAQLLGVGDRLGSIEVGKEATLFVADGDILDIRSNVQRMWIAGKEIRLDSRHTRLYEKYRNRPNPR